MSSTLSLVIKIYNFEFKHDEITNILNLEPTEILYKNQFLEMGHLDSKIFKKIEQNYWEYRVVFETKKWIRDEIDFFVSVKIRNKFEEFEKLTSMGCLKELYVSVFYDKDASRGFHFPYGFLYTLGKLEIDFGFDEYDKVEGNG